MSSFSFSRTDTSLLARWLWTIDRPLLISFAVLMAIGLVLVAAASPPVAERIGVGSYHFLFRHFIFLVPTCFALLAVSFLPARWVWRLAAVTLAGTMVALTLVLMVGDEIKGAQRWLHVAGFSLQPSEFVKPSFAVVAAWLIAYQKAHENFPANLICAGLFFLIVALLMLQPDLGMTLVVTAILAVQIFLAGLPFRYLLIFGLAGLSFLAFAYSTFGHVQSRIDRFLDPASGDTYQIDKSLEAFRQGGVMGVGPGQGDVKLSLPDAHADFIFSVGGEELGLWFSLCLLILYFYIVRRGLRVLGQSKCLFTVLAGGGLIVMIGLQAFIHMGSALQLLPTKGMTLPFISYGGSSMLSTGLGMGMLLALLRRQDQSVLSNVPSGRNDTLQPKLQS